jgi:outer membrane protein assembly factor BamB
MHCKIAFHPLVAAAAFLFLPVEGIGSARVQAESKSQTVNGCEAAGITGGLCVTIGCEDSRSVAELVGTGRYLVHILDWDKGAIDGVRAKLQEMGLYGLASAELLGAEGKLPYTENLVNVVFFGDKAVGRIPIREVVRVLHPNGMFFCAGKEIADADLAAAGLSDICSMADGSPGKRARKPWPKGLDQWSHPRHAADGNAVSCDQFLGPPRRIRWVTGPQQEISNMVTAGGRSFFAGVLARDAFNGLRLWESRLNPSPARGGFNDRALPGSVRPIATPKSLLVVTDKTLRALDAATGRQVREYPEAGSPAEILVEGGMILAIDKEAVRGVDLETGRLRWKQDADRARCAVAGDGQVCFLQGDPARSESLRLTCRELAGGTLRWERGELAWLPRMRQGVYHQGLLACEISTLQDDKPGNMIQVLSASDGVPLWSREYVPGASHKKQARAMFIGELLWVLEEKRCVGLEPRTGTVRKTWPAPATHCFPPVASTRYLFSGELDLTDLETGRADANRITKTACSRDAGIVPANGLLYTFPKHCICWPMLRDYAALAPASPGGVPCWDDVTFTPEPGPAQAPAGVVVDNPARQWPCYRHDAFRSGSTTGRVPRELKILWATPLGRRPESVIAEDWRCNYFIRGPIGPPVVAGGMVYVARPDAHQVAALDAKTGGIRWTFTANGRVDTAPTIHRGLCLFGCKSGWVYCLRADNGAMVWRLRAAPLDERIVAYGQIESPWPVPGSVLVVDDVVYFAAGRHSLADGGILVFAVEPASGRTRWVQRLDSVPQRQFYGSSGLEFDNFDLLQCEGNAVAMSRWLFDRATGKITCREKAGFARLGAGGSGVMFPRGSWSYAPGNESEQWPERPFVRPLAVFRENTLYGCSQDRRTLLRRDFRPDADEKFDADWFSGWTTYSRAGKGGDLWRSQRVARGATWTTALSPSPLSKNSVSAMILAGDALYVASSQGGLVVFDTKDGRAISQWEVPPPLWDGMAAAEGCVILSTQDGRVICLGENLR